MDFLVLISLDIGSEDKGFLQGKNFSFQFLRSTVEWVWGGIEEILFLYLVGALRWDK